MEEYVKPDGRLTRQRDFIYKALNDIPGISAVKPKGAFYIFPKIDTAKFGVSDDMQFALDFLKEKKVMVVQGTGFNWIAPDHFRIVYLPRLEILEESMKKLKDFMAGYHQ